MRKSFSTIETLNLRDTSPDSDTHSVKDLHLLNLRLTVPSTNPSAEQIERNCGDNYHNPSADLKQSLPLRPPLLPHPKLQLTSSTSVHQQRDFVVGEPINEHDFLFPSRRRCGTARKQVVAQKSEEDYFPFSETSSGNLKVHPRQVVFSTKKLSVLVADPDRTRISVDRGSTMASRQHHESGDILKSGAMQTIMSQEGITSLGSLIGNTPTRTMNKEASEYEGRDTSDILNPEMNLGRLGYSGTDAISWERVQLPEKRNLYLELFSRITNYKNADCKVYIDNHEFNCHLIVLQCYSELFDAYIAVKKVEIPADKCSPAAFAFIYDWMITGEPSYRDLNRDNVLDIFTAAKYLKVQDLVDQCWVFIDNTDVFNEDTAFLLYMEAKDRELPEVRELMLPRIQNFFLMLVSSKDWLEMELDDVKNLLKSNYICVNCELEIFMSAVRWLKHNWGERDCFKYAVLECVRFGNIAPWQLVDIKKNPENPDFLELANDARICKMIDDGLNFVIIKYFYGEDNEYFRQWNSSLGLYEPSPRNWSGSDKTYFTYREFLIYLDQYRRNQFNEIDKPLLKNEHHTKYGPDMSKKQNQAAATSGQEKMVPQVPTMDEFLCKRKKREDAENKAARIIQFAYKSYKHKRDEQRISDDVKTNKTHDNCKEKEILELFRRKCHESRSTKRTINSETILIFGGLDPQSSNGIGRNTAKSIYSYAAKENCWAYIGDLPEPRQYHNTVMVNGRVYLAGGCDPRMERPKALDTMWSYDPITRTWYSEERMLVARKNFGMIFSEGGLFALGGRGLNNESVKSVERFDVKSGVWERKSAMIFGRVGGSYANYMGFIWAAGGICKRDVLNTVEIYNSNTDQWTEVTSLPFPRCFGAMLVLSNQLYVVGGAGSFNKAQGMSDSSLGVIEVWNQSLNDWEYITELAIARHCHCLAALGSQIFVIGGLTKNYTQTLNSVECFCTERKAFVRGVASLPSPLSGLSAVTLQATDILQDK